MAISLFASLASSLAVNVGRTSGILPPQGGIDTSTTDTPFLGLGDIDVVFALCGDKQNQFLAAVSLPVRL